MLYISCLPKIRSVTKNNSNKIHKPKQQQQQQQHIQRHPPHHHLKHQSLKIIRCVQTWC